MSSRILLAISLATVLALPGGLLAQDQPEVKIGGKYDVESIKDIPYFTGKDRDDNKHKLDLYIPKGQKDYPVLFFVHGGAWASGDRKLYTSLGQTFAKNGIGTVVISYRLSPGVQHPAHIEDVARAFAWTHQNIAKHGGKPDRIFVSGHSAGGHLAALLVTNEQYLAAHKLSSKDVRAVLPLSGVYTMRESPRMEKVVGKGKDAYDNASPTRHVSGKEPPFLIVYADSDFPGCDKMSEAICQLLRKSKVPAETVSIKDRSHISIMVRLMTSEADPATQAMLKFIAKHSELLLISKPATKTKQDP